MSDAADWRVAFAKQARADLAAREVLLRDPRLPACQQLHFLQMACEKICKAFLCRPGSDPTALQSSHAYVATTLPQIVRHHLATNSPPSSSPASWLLPAVRSLARQIELLAPAVDDGGRSPANCEYPWEDAKGVVHVPAEHPFEINLLYARAGRTLLKLLYVAIDDLVATAD